MTQLPLARIRALLDRISQTRVLVVGDVMLDHFIWGRVSRISPEAPVPIVDFERESFMPGGAANVARNLTALGGQADLFGIVGNDPNASHLRRILRTQRVGCRSLFSVREFITSTKTRIVAQKQQVTRLDRETHRELPAAMTQKLVRSLTRALAAADAVSIGDYAKGVVTQALIDEVRAQCRARGCWLSFDPKPSHALDIRGLSLLTPNRKEAFQLAGLEDSARRPNPLEDKPLRQVADQLLKELEPALLLITLGELGMLLCQRGRELFHVPTVAQDVFDVSGAGDTVIASFTLAIAAGASPVEAAIFSNHAAGVVVGKVGTATVSATELLASFAKAA